MKKLGVISTVLAGTATTGSWKAQQHEILNNNGVLPVRIDKMMMGAGYYHDAAQVCMVGVIIHLTDTNGNSFLDTFDGGSGDATSDLNTLMEKWKDYIWATDFRPCAVGSTIVNNVDMDMATKRILEPGQKLLASIAWMSGSATGSNYLRYLLDYNIWHQQAASQ